MVSSVSVSSPRYKSPSLVSTVTMVPSASYSKMAGMPMPRLPVTDMFHSAAQLPLADVPLQPQEKTGAIKHSDVTGGPESL
eukprot:9549496-Prorocentrum_lima.AAC.1